MARLNSFYLSPDKWQKPFTLQDGEARHMLKVLRTPVGETVRIFDGQGRSGLFELLEATKSKAVLAPLSEEFLEDSRNLTLAIGWNKSSRRGWILEKAVELGCRSIIFFQAERSQGKIPDKSKEKWQDALITAAKQCGNVWLPEIKTIGGGIDGLTEISGEFDNKTVLWENQGKDSLFNPADFSKGQSIVVIGPEGGLSKLEVSKIELNGFKPLSLGTSILRWETAAVLCLSACYLESQKHAQ
jgi:16S rRNA (uracil1498-N3)-methyltransferase